MIQEGEIWQLVKWVLLWVGSWFVAYNLREILAVQFSTPQSQILFGIGILLFVAFFWDIRKYAGR